MWQLLYFLFLWQSLYRISNAALSTLLNILSVFVRLFGSVLSSDHDIATKQIKIPGNTAAASKLLQIMDKDDFIEYVVCPKCQSVYSYSDCVYTRGGHDIPKVCSHIPYPNHTYLSKRGSCGAALLKKVKTGRKTTLVPIKVYPYQPLYKSFNNLVKKEGFLDACEMWRNRPTSDTHLVDIYDGRVWSEYKSNGFLESPFSYLLTLNLDWFQPFSRVEYSVGAIYLSIQNLPCSERYKEENVILVGVLPGPSEPKLTVNSYITPLIEELEMAWNDGIKVTTQDGSEITIRLALTLVTCDIPASRKLCGFLGHNATLGCNKCLKSFNCITSGTVDYSGYDRENWTFRTGQGHREQCRKVLNENTKTRMRNIESTYGVRYSTLLMLPYFDPVRFTVVEIMHNLFLGTGKYMFKVWLSLNLLTKENLLEIEETISSFTVPHNLGRLPINIASNYGGYTAAQWKLWITLYSQVALKDVLPSSHYQCWLLFTRACSILSRRVITRDDIITADLLLLNFCKKFELLYGKEMCTPNLHLHLHLKECLLDYGPSHTFWCFSFERYNGMLGSFHTNRKTIETQIMKKFVYTQKLLSAKHKANSEFLLLFSFDQKFSNLTTESDHDIFDILNMSVSPPLSIPSFQKTNVINLLPPFHEDIFVSELLNDLETFYTMLYPQYSIECISPFFVRFGRVTLCDQLIGSVMNSRSSKSSAVITAYWPTTGCDLTSINYGAHMRVGTVQYFCNHQVVLRTVDNTTQKFEHVLAYVQWKKKHQNEEWFGISATVCCDLPEPASACSFIPVQRIHSVCAYSLLNIEIGTLRESVFVAVPIPTRFCL